MLPSILGPIVTVFLVTGAFSAEGKGLPDPDRARVKADLDFLCSDDLQGRETGTPGEAKAAAYLAQKMQEAGLVPIKAGGFGGATPFHFLWTYDGGPGGGWMGEKEAHDVVGIIPGGDSVLGGEYVFVTAHFDHLGNDDGTLYRGADDDASGTAGLLEVMRLLKDAHPRRTLAFMGVSGEEEGLLGSEAFLADAPLPVTAIKADINMDMIGRGREGELHVMPARREGYVTTLTAEARSLAEAQGIALSAGIEDYWQDSDHYSFALRSIPAICFNTGLHADYHQPTDTPDKINYNRLASVVKIVRDLALVTANADSVPVVLPGSVWKSWVWGPYRSPNLLQDPPVFGINSAAGETCSMPGFGR
jgi:hypothetical protein